MGVVDRPAGAATVAAGAPDGDGLVRGLRDRLDLLADVDAYRRGVARGRLPASPFRLPGAPWTNALALASIALVAVLLAFDDEQRIALLAGAVWAALVAAGWIALRQRQRHAGWAARLPVGPPGPHPTAG